MLAGHFGVSYALKAKENHASLGLLFLAVGFADLLWSLFILLGREQAQLAPNLQSSRLNLSYAARFLEPLVHLILVLNRILYNVCMKNSDNLPIISFETQQSWEAWLKEHHNDTKGIWLKIAKKETGIP